MIKEELIGNQKKAIRLLWLLIGILIPTLIILGVLIETAFAGQRDLAFRISLFLIIIAIFGSIHWIGRKTDTRCPNCKKSLQGGIYTPLLIATGKCGHCGATILDEPEADQAGAECLHKVSGPLNRDVQQKP